MDRLNDVLRETQATQRQAAATLRAAAAPPPTPEEQLGLALKPGARVFDTVTGQEGEIIAGGKPNYVIPPSER